MNTDKTLVVFRKYPHGEIIALFPEMIFDNEGNCGSYVHVGQHSAANYGWVMMQTERTTPGEYEDLKTELESIGYDLLIRQKWIRKKGYSRADELSKALRR